MKNTACVTMWICGVVGAALCLPGCAVPKLHIEAEPTHTAVYVDGKHVFTRQPPSDKAKLDADAAEPTPPETSLETPLRYYGTATISGTMPTTEWVDVRHNVTIDEPFSPWLLPFDFVLECVTYPFRGDRYENRVTVALTPRREETPGVSPREIPALKARASAALGER